MLGSNGNSIFFRLRRTDHQSLTPDLLASLEREGEQDGLWRVELDVGDPKKARQSGVRDN